MLRKSLLLLSIPIFLFVGCSKSIDNSEINSANTNTETETFLSVPKESNTPLSFNDKNISPTKFITYGSLIFFPSKDSNNYLSVITDKLDSTYINSDSIIDIFNYSMESIATIGDDIFFSNISDNNSLYKLDYLKKNITKVYDSSFYNISASQKYLYFINKSENSKLSLYDIDKNQIKAITADKCGKYVVNGDFILYENISDGSTLYSIKTDGSQRRKLTTDPIDSFIPFNNNNILYINGRDNNLYNYNTLLDSSNRIHLLNGTNLKGYDNNFFYVDLSNSNHLYKLEIDESISKAWTEEITTDMVNEYYPTSKGIFYNKPIDITTSYFSPYR